MWYPLSDSHRDTVYFEYTRYTNSRQVGTHIGPSSRSRTEKLYVLSVEGMPIPFKLGNVASPAGLEPALAGVETRCPSIRPQREYGLDY